MLQVTVYSELASLEPLLLQLKENITFPKKRYTGDYWIEIFHVK